MTEEEINLRTYIEALLTGLEKRIDDRFESVDDKIEALETTVGDKFKASDVAVLAALVGKDKAVDAAFLAAREASAKTEEAQRVYNSGHNGLLQKMNEQYDHMMPRTEVIARLEAIEAKIEQGRGEIQSLRETRSQGQGSKDNKTANAFYVIAGCGMFISVVSVIVSVVLHFAK
jgi:hypothetical protein